MTFNNAKDEMLAFTRKKKSELKRTLAKARVIVHGHTIGIGADGTRWLEVYLDIGLQFRTHNNFI